MKRTATGKPESSIKLSQCAVSFSESKCAEDGPAAPELEIVAEEVIAVEKEGQLAAADSAEELIRRSSISTEGDLQVAGCLNKLAKVMKNHQKPKESEVIRKRARNIVARELNQLDGVDP